MVHQAKDLSAEQRAAIESLLGRRISEQETISIRAFQPPTISDQRRQELVEGLQQYFAEVDANHKAVSDEEADEILTEAMRTTRPNYRSRR